MPNQSGPSPLAIFAAIPLISLQGVPFLVISSTFGGPARAAHGRLANAIRALAMDAVEQAKSGHPGLPMGAADVATVLFTRFLKFDPAAPPWPDRDRFVLSAGHGSMLLYALLHLLGYEAMTIDEIKRFRQLGSRTAGHPEYGHAPGIETTTGPLGQGLANAVGMAIAERHLAAEFGADVVDHRTYVIASDGDLMEGISQEAIALAGHLELNRLIVLFDDNGISIDGPLSLAELGRPGQAVRGLRLERLPRRRPRPGRDRRRDRSGADVRPPEPDRLPHHHRLRRAHQGGQREGARLAARRRGGRRARAKSSAGRRRRSKCRPTSREAWREAGSRARRPRALAWEQRLASARAGRARRVRAPARRRPAAEALAAAVRGMQGEARRGAEGDRDPRRLGDRARSARRRRAGDGRRVGRPHRLQQHADRRAWRR